MMNKSNINTNLPLFLNSYHFAFCFHTHSLPTGIIYLSTEITTNAFNSVIPNTFITSINKPLILHLNINVFDYLAEFSKHINTKIPKDNIYTVFLKIR